MALGETDITKVDSMTEGKHPNPVIRYFQIVRPQLWEAPDYEKVAFLFHHGMCEGSKSWEDITDALAELIPEQRDFWLRVQATWNSQFIHAMAAMLNDQTELTDDECTVIGAAIAAKEQK